jgi:hypothetical protein
MSQLIEIVIDVSDGHVSKFIAQDKTIATYKSEQTNHEFKGVKTIV